MNIKNDKLINNNTIKTLSNKQNEKPKDKNKKGIKVIDKNVSTKIFYFSFIIECKN